MLDLIEVGLSLLNEMNREQINRVVLNKYQNPAKFVFYL